MRLVGRNDHTRLTPLLESSMQLTCRAIMLIVQAHQCQSWGRIIRRGGTDTPSHMIDVARGSMCCVGGGDEPVRCQQLLHLRIGQWTAHLIACDLVGRGDEAVRDTPYMVNGARDRAARSLLVELERLLIDTDGPD